MKIVFIGPVYPYRGGIAHFQMQLAESVAEAGHALKIFSFKRQYPRWLYPGTSDKIPGDPVFGKEVAYLLDPLYPWTWTQTVDKLLEFQPDRVVIQWWTTFWAPTFAWMSRRLSRSGIPVSYVIHNVLPHEKKFYDPWLARWALKNGEQFILMSQREQARLKSLLPSASRCAVTRHPIVRLFEALQLSKEEARVRFNIPQDKTVFLFFGLIRPYKGLGLLIDALKKIRSIDNLPHLIIAGECWDNLAAYENQIRDQQLNNQVTFINRYISDEELAVVMSAADIYVAPYIGGTQSGAARVAMSFHLPIIASDVIAEDLIATGYPALSVVPAQDVDALSLAMERWITQPPSPPAGFSDQNDWRDLVDAIVGLTY